MTPRFSIGDNVTIVNYGALIWQLKSEIKPDNFIFEDDMCQWLDMRPELVGQEAIITNVTVTQNKPQYAIEIDGKHHSWFDEQQLETTESHE